MIIILITWRTWSNRSNTNLRLPPLYKVLLHNDDYTTMEFVVEVLQKIFHKNAAEATQNHAPCTQDGSGVCGIFTEDVAETKVEIVHHLARKSGFPLRCTMEEA